jgi:hypothetical protein
MQASATSTSNIRTDQSAKYAGGPPRSIAADAA